MSGQSFAALKYPFAESETSFVELETSFATSEVSFARSETSFAELEASFTTSESPFVESKSSFAESEVSFVRSEFLFAEDVFPLTLPSSPNPRAIAHLVGWIDRTFQSAGCCNPYNCWVNPAKQSTARVDRACHAGCLLRSSVTPKMSL